MKRTRVLVVGAGPVGAVAAYRLAEMGVDTTLLEAHADCVEDMRASTFHPPTLDMMEELGLFDALDEQGLRAPVYQYRNRKSGARIEFDLSEISDVSAHPYRLQCEQFKLSRLITSLLENHPHGAVEFRSRVLSCEQDAAGVTVRVETPVAIETYHCDYLIAADGSSSTIRKWLNIGFSGFTYPERFLTLSTAYPLDESIEGLSHVNYMVDDKQWCVLLRVPKLWRALVPTTNEQSDAELLADASKNRIFGDLIGHGEDIVTGHRTLYRVHQRVADRFFLGRVILVGDAAHLNNPLGGFGMNSGIHDAWNVTEKLRAILLEAAPAQPLLETYDRQRRMVTNKFVQTQTIRNKQMLETSGAEAVKAEEARLARIAENETQRRAYLLHQSMYDSLKQEAALAP